MRSKIILITGLLFLMSCEQTPSTLDEEPFLEDAGNGPFSAEIANFEFDFFSKTFFFSIIATDPSVSPSVNADLIVSDKILASFTLNDSGKQDDIYLQDDSFDGNWSLPDSMEAFIDSSWILNVTVSSGSDHLQLSSTLKPSIPEAPIILSVNHKDTLTLNLNDLTFDTLTVQVGHPQGLDEIRDVSFFSLKPDGNYARQGQPIPLLDDGAKDILYPYQGYEITSGDKVANDGIYSLVLPLASGDLIGTYYWTFNSRSWEGLEAESFEDSLIVLGAPGSTTSMTSELVKLGVFQ